MESQHQNPSCIAPFFLAYSVFEFAGSMANHSDRWYFCKEKIRNSPSVLDGIEHAKELGYRQQCANLIQDIGQKLQVNQLVINTAIVYMHRFYMFHSFNVFHRNIMAACFLFLAAKVEEQPRKLEHILKASHLCLHSKEDPPLDPKSDEYMQISIELVNNESVLLQTLGFEVSVDHPNTFVVKCAQLVKASKELAQTAYFLATNSLHLTTFCIQYKPTLVACVCIYVACLWANYVIPETDGKNWYEYMDNTATKKQLEDLSSYFIKILDSCPTRLKKRLTSGGAVVYKDGKVTQKKDTDANDKPSKYHSTDKQNNKQDTSSTNSSKTSHSSENCSKPVHTKNLLTGLLKPHSHDATPPPSRPSSSHAHYNQHSKKPHENHKKVNPAMSSLHHQEHRKHQMMGSNRNKEGHELPSKTAEQLKMEQRKKWTPEQIEEYRKRKEKEKLMQRKKMLESNGKTKEKGEGQFDGPPRVRKSSFSESPVKRQKLDSDHSKRIHATVHESNHSNRPIKDSLKNPDVFPRKSKENLKSFSSVDGKISRLNSSSSIHQKPVNNIKSPPPPPPPLPPNKKNEQELATDRKEVRLKHEYPSSKLNAPHYTSQKISPPPPPPPVDPKYY